MYSDLLSDKLYRLFFLGESNSPSEPNSSIKQSKDEVVIKIDLPGVKKEDTKVEIGIAPKEDTLFVTATREEKKLTWSRSLSKYADTDKMEARLEDGVLTIKIPVKEKESRNSKEITIL